MRHEASWGAVGSTYWLSWSSGFASLPAPLTFLIESMSSVLRKAAKSPVAAGNVQDKSGILYTMTTLSMMKSSYHHRSRHSNCEIRRAIR